MSRDSNENEAINEFCDFLDQEGKYETSEANYHLPELTNVAAFLKWLDELELSVWKGFQTKTMVIRSAWQDEEMPWGKETALHVLFRSGHRVIHRVPELVALAVLYKWPDAVKVKNVRVLHPHWFLQNSKILLGLSPARWQAR